VAKVTYAGERPDGLIEAEEWIKLMRQIYRVLEAQLTHLEARANLAGTTADGRQRDGKAFETSDVHALRALSTTVGQVRILNGDIKEDQLSESARQQLKEAREKQAELERRIERLKVQGEDQ
jgi:BMFP domain-containing protein YqiC